MKNRLRTLAATTLILSSLNLLANPTAAPGKSQDNPCLKLQDACKQGGFVKSETKPKTSIVKACLATLLKGGSVPGVMVGEADVKACQDQKLHSVKK